MAKVEKNSGSKVDERKNIERTDDEILAEYDREQREKRLKKAKASQARKERVEKVKEALSLRSIGYALLCVAIAAGLIWLLFGTGLGRGIRDAVANIAILLAVVFGCYWLWTRLTKKKAKKESKKAKKDEVMPKKRKPAEKKPAAKPAEADDDEDDDEDEEASFIRRLAKKCFSDSTFEAHVWRVFREEDPEADGLADTSGDGKMEKRIREIATKVYSDKEYSKWFSGIWDSMAPDDTDEETE